MNTVVKTKFSVKPVVAALAVALSAASAYADPTPTQLPGAGLIRAVNPGTTITSPKTFYCVQTAGVGCVAGTGGAMMGNLFWYLVARVIGIDRFRPFIERWGRWLTMHWAEVERGQKMFATYGAAFVFFGRLLPTIRSLISVPAGLLKLRLSTFLIWSTIGTAGWTALLAIAGYELGQRFDEVETVIGPLSTAIIVVIVLGYLWRLVTWKPAKR